MPQFEPSVQKTAVAPITVQPAGLSYEVELFLGPNEVTPAATSGRLAFISTGSQQQVRLPVIMPSAPGIYHVYLDLFIEGMIIASYIVVEDLEIVPREIAGQFVDAYQRTLIPPEGRESPAGMTAHVLTTPSGVRTYTGKTLGWVYLLETITIYWQNLSTVPIKGEITASLRPHAAEIGLCRNLVQLIPLSGFEKIVNPGGISSVTFSVPKPGWAGIIYAQLFTNGNLLDESPWGVGYEGEPLGLQTFWYYEAPGGAVYPSDYYVCPL